jgi:uncharacterized protein YodC (DUF2158 family)
METIDFEIGSTVVLKSGGPCMTIGDIDTEEKIVECLWFNHKEELQTAQLRFAVIETLNANGMDDEGSEQKENLSARDENEPGEEEEVEKILAASIKM